MIEIHIANDWRAKAACRDASPNDFVAGDAFDDYDPEYPSPAAKAYCDRCPVLVECDAEATANPETYGVWAGKTRYQRQQLRRRMNRATCPNCSSKNMTTLDGIETCLACGQSWEV